MDIHYFSLKRTSVNLISENLYRLLHLCVDLIHTRLLNSHDSTWEVGVHWTGLKDEFDGKMENFSKAF